MSLFTSNLKPLWPSSTFISFLASAYSSFVLGCKNTGKLLPTEMKPFSNISLALDPITTQSFSKDLIPKSSSLIAPPTK